MAQINSSIPFAAFPQRNMLESFNQGQQMRQESQMGGLKVQGAQNALAMQTAEMLARGVLSSDNPQAAYPRALAQARSMGMDVSKLPQEWGPDAEMLTRMSAMPAGERTDFMRAMEMIPPEQRGQAAAVKLGLAPKAGSDAPTALDRKISTLVESGVPIDMARGIAAGRYVSSRDPISGQAQVVDKATGEVIGNVPAQGAAPAAPGAAPEAAAEPTSVPSDVDYGSALGAEGLVSNIANTVADAIGVDLPAPQAERATQALTNLKVRTKTTLQDAVPGRPSNYLLQELDRLTVSPGSVLQGEQRAQERLAQTRDLIRRGIEENDAILNNPGQYRPLEVSQARIKKTQMESLLRDYETILQTMEQRGRGSAPRAPEPGMVEDGYRFKGGDPADPSNWEQVR